MAREELKILLWAKCIIRSSTGSVTILNLLFMPLSFYSLNIVISTDFFFWQISHMTQIPWLLSGMENYWFSWSTQICYCALDHISDEVDKLVPTVNQNAWYCSLWVGSFGVILNFYDCYFSFYEIIIKQPIIILSHSLLPLKGRRISYVVIILWIISS